MIQDTSIDGPSSPFDKPMSRCSGREIMTEVSGHPNIAADAAGILASCTCIPCMMPFFTSRTAGYPVRSAHIQGKSGPRVLLNASRALHDRSA